MVGLKAMEKDPMHLMGFVQLLQLVAINILNYWSLRLISNLKAQTQ